MQRQGQKCRSQAWERPRWGAILTIYTGLDACDLLCDLEATVPGTGRRLLGALSAAGVQGPVGHHQPTEMC